MIKILFFGPVAARVGQHELSMSAMMGMTVQDVYQQMQQRYPLAFEIVCFTALNGEMLRDLSPRVKAGDEVVFMSKFSGG